jgi:hypothetical protein
LPTIPSASNFRGLNFGRTVAAVAEPAATSQWTFGNGAKHVGNEERR